MKYLSSTCTTVVQCLPSIYEAQYFLHRVLTFVSVCSRFYTVYFTSICIFSFVKSLRNIRLPILCGCVCTKFKLLNIYCLQICHILYVSFSNGAVYDREVSEEMCCLQGIYNPNESVRYMIKPCQAAREKIICMGFKEEPMFV